MNPHDLTAFFEFVDANHAKHPEGDPMRVGVPGGWEYSERKLWCSWGYIPRMAWRRDGIEAPRAELIDHQAACHCMSEWLSALHYLSVVRSYGKPDGWIAYSTIDGIISSKRKKLDCPDDPLAARLAAAEEIEGWV